jgi:hypothetical protein
MLTVGNNYYKYNDDGSLDAERTCEAYIDYLEELSREDSKPETEVETKEEDSGSPAKIYVALTTPSSKHWYEKPIAGAQGSFYSHAGLTFDEKMSAMYNIRSKGLIVTKRKEFEKEKINIDIYEYQITLKQKRKIQKIVKAFVKTVSTAYDFLMIGKLLGKIIFKKRDKEVKKEVTVEEVVDKKKYICSGWVAGIFAAAIPKFRMYLYKNHVKWPSFMPEDFVRVPNMKLIKRLVFPQNKTIITFK